MTTAVKDGRLSKVRIRDIMKLLKRLGGGKATRAFARLPSPIRTKDDGVALHFQKR